MKPVSSTGNRPTIGAHRAREGNELTSRPQVARPKPGSPDPVPGRGDRFEKARPGRTAFQSAANAMTPGAIAAPPPGSTAAGGSQALLGEIARFPPLQFLQGLTGVAGQLAGAPMAPLNGGYQPLPGFSDQGSIGPRAVHQTAHGLAGGGVHTNTTSAGLDAGYQTHGQLGPGPAGGIGGQAGVSGRAGPTVETRGTIQNDTTRLDYSGRAGVEARGQANANAEAGPLGARAGGDVGGELWAGAEGDARLTNQYGSGGVWGRAGARAFAQGDGNLEIGPTGARGRLGGGVGAMVEAEAGADFRSHGVPLGGETFDIRGSVRGRAEAGAKAEGGIQADATLQPPRLGGEIGGTAFAGAKAEAEAKVGLGEFVSVTGRAGAWAGAGAEGKGILGFDDGKIRFGLSGGAAVGYGAGARGVVEVDVKKMANAAIGTGVQFASKAPTYATNPAELVFDVSKLAFGMASQGQQFAMGLGQVATEAPSMILQAVGGLGGAPPAGGAGATPASGAGPSGPSVPSVPGTASSIPDPVAIAGGGRSTGRTRGRSFERSRPTAGPSTTSSQTPPKTPRA